VVLLFGIFLQFMQIVGLEVQSLIQELVITSQMDPVTHSQAINPTELYVDLGTAVVPQETHNFFMLSHIFGSEHKQLKASIVSL